MMQTALIVYEQGDRLGTTQQPEEKFGKTKELATVLRYKLGSV